jgi:uncharacterized membrane protein YheB (UPF0754 family)
MGWWSTRTGIVGDNTRPHGRRIWALCEIVCASLTLVTLAAALALSCLRLAGSPLLASFPHWIMQLALAGAVGYGTNFLAVQMLFKPKERVTWFPLNWLWPQGLIPARQEEMAIVVGEEVATKLLTPSVMASEITQVLSGFLDEPDSLDDFSDAILGLLGEAVPGFLERFSSELFEAIEAFVVEGLSNEKVREQLLEVLETLLDDKSRVDDLTAITLAFLTEHSDELIDLLKTILRRYKKKGSQAQAFGFKLAKSSNVLNWKKIRKALRDVLRKPSGKEWVLEFNSKLVKRLPDIVDQILDDAALEELKLRVGKLIDSADSRLIEQQLAPRVLKLVTSEAFRTYLKTVLVPEAKTHLEAWIDDGHLGPFLTRIDIRARVAEAAGALDTDELEEMANRVGAEHFGAIQVLGYVLGLCAGVLIVLVDG